MTRDRVLAALDALRSAAGRGTRFLEILLTRAEEVERDAEDALISDAEIERTIGEHAATLDRRLSLLRFELRRAANHGLTPAPRVKDVEE